MTLQHCEVNNHLTEGEVYPLKIFGTKGKRVVCAACLRKIRAALPNTKLITPNVHPYLEYWEVQIILPSRRPCAQTRYEVELTPWQAGLLRLAGFEIEEV